MNGCQGHTSACNGHDLRPVKLGLQRVVLVMCAGCRSTSIAISAIVERRVEPQPVLVERRGIRRPAWLGRLTARDETGRAFA